eukprot:5010199-Prymnesium_polylepis.1
MNSAADGSAYAVAIGVVSTEHKPERRRWLRALYRRSGSVLVRFVLDAAWLAKQPTLVGDEIGVPMRAGSHCVDKSFGWWRAARRWSARHYLKTDDDVVIDIREALSMLAVLPPLGVMAGPLWYTTLNTTTLRPHNPTRCTTHGAVLSAAQTKAHDCPLEFGPYPYVAGPFEVLSGDIVDWLAPRLTPKPLQRC